MPIINQVVSGGGSSAPAHYIEKAVDANGKLFNGSSNVIDLTGVTDIGDYGLFYAYYQNTAVSGAVDMSDLTTVSGLNACQNMFRDCTGLTSVDLSSLQSVEVQQRGCSNMFQGCTGLTSANLPALTTVSSSYGCNEMFSGCIGLTSANLSALTTVSGSYACQAMFSSCTSLATVYIGGTTAIDFGTRTNQFNNMFQYCAQNIDVYAPAANQAQIEAFSGYPKFGATGTVTWHWRS